MNTHDSESRNACLRLSATFRIGGSVHLVRADNQLVRRQPASPDSHKATSDSDGWEGVPVLLDSTTRLVEQGV